VAANGACFRKDIPGVIPEIIDEYYGNRKVIKTEMLKVEGEMELIKSAIVDKVIERNPNVKREDISIDNDGKVTIKKDFTVGLKMAVL
jgi:DNA polymerase elongation subunit (family B)